MIRLISLILFGLLITAPMTVAVPVPLDETPVKEESSNYTYENEEDFNFEDNSYNISDEQAQEVKDMNKIEDNSDFDTKIINSSHFSSGTATRTWIPINRRK